MTVPVYIISLASAQHRRAFQEMQAQRLGFKPIWQAAIGLKDFSDEEFLQHAFCWQRPLKKTEVGCFLSHLEVWQSIAQGEGPAVVLEDDVILSEDWYQDILTLVQTSCADYICLETWGKKILGQFETVNDLKLQRLHLNSAGAAGYLLWPSGARILIKHHKENGTALADAFINAVRDWRAWQLVPANLVQMNVAKHFGQQAPISTESLIAREIALPIYPNRTTFLRIKFRRVFGEFRRALGRLSYLFTARKVVALKALIDIKANKP
ncbi:glycosyltransferase family 25 protein [Comamonadaceae bacterium M7527]|nr:glycosyltransferase family 25 protein [Comamonadaceae bacterium M7527]